jgi:hypothetical protein
VLVLACLAWAPASSAEPPGRGDGRRAGEQWAVRIEFRLGRFDGPEEELFSGSLLGVAIGPQGQIFVLDSQLDEIRVFDGRGTYLRTIGRPGPGPKELESGRFRGGRGACCSWTGP